MARLTRALWHTSEEQSVLLEEPLPAFQEGCCLVQTAWSLLSCGTERLVALGRVPPELQERMRVPYMGGAFPFPVKYGYSLVGRVVAGPRPWRGRWVQAMHPHQEAAWMRIEDLNPLPEGMPPRRAALFPNVETALTALWDAPLKIGERVLVVGFGLVGSLVARLVQPLPGVELVVVEKQAQRAALATQMGFCVQDAAQLPAAFDCAFHCSASAAGLQLCLDHLGPEGTAVDLSWYGTRSVPLKLGGRFHPNRLTVKSSQVSSLPPAMRPRWSHQRRREAVWRLLNDPLFDQHLTHTLPFESAPAFFQSLRKGVPPGLGYVLQYGGGEGG
ncbi:MAG: dehydrogenase [Bacteroidetes bacterium]|nr:MAG: dehydrogenase [Bacteroidota bacterium]